MTFVIWGLPLLLFSYTSWYFNNQKKETIRGYNVILYTIFDTLVSYTITLFILRLTLDSIRWSGVVLCIVFLISAGIHLSFSNKEEPFVTVIETIKNNLTIAFTLFIPFVIFSFLFKDFSSIFTYGLAIIIAVLIFGLSLFVKRYTTKFIDKIKYNIQLTTDMVLSGIFYAVTASVIIGLLVLTVSSIKTFKQPQILYDDYQLFSVNKDDIINWDSFTVLDMITSNGGIRSGIGDKTALVRDADNKEFIIMYHYPTTTNFFTTIYELSSDTTIDTPRLDNSTRILYNGEYIVLPNTGLYTYTENGVTLQMGSDGYFVSYFKTTDESVQFLVDHLDGTYEIWDEDYQKVEDIDYTTSNNVLTVVNDYLFIEDSNSITRYDDSTISFTAHSGTKYYDNFAQTLFTVQYSTDSAEIIQESGSQEYTYIISISEDEQVLPIFDGYLINTFQLLNLHQTIQISDELYINSSYSKDSGWFSVMVYQPNEYHLKFSNSTSILQVTKFESLTSTPKMYYTGEYNFFTSTAEIQHKLTLSIIIYLLFPVVFFFVPISNNTKYTRTVDYDHALSGELK